MIRLRVDPLAPDRGAIDTAAAAIRAGGLVVVPTDTLYGLAANPFNQAAVARIYALKGRDASRALPLIAADLDQVREALGALPPAAQALADRFWPGPLTIIVPAPPGIVADVTGGTSRIGIRVPDQRVATDLCRMSDTLLTATSANISGMPASANPDAVVAGLGARVSSIDVLLDAGLTAGGEPSTIVDVCERPARLVRAGAIPWGSLQAWLT